MDIDWNDTGAVETAAREEYDLVGVDLSQEDMDDMLGTFYNQCGEPNADQRHYMDLQETDPYDDRI